MNERVQRLQTHLSLIRTCAGWSASELGKRLDVSRQMVSNLENGQNKMTQMQYLAIRKVFDDEIAYYPGDTVMLRDILNVLVDEPEKYSDEGRNKALSDANLLSPSIVAKKATRKNASIAWAAAFTGVAVAAISIGIKAMRRPEV